MKLNWSPIQASAIRLKPGDDLKSELMKLATENQLQAAIVLSAVGSLSSVSLRLANDSKLSVFQGKHEIITLTGTFAVGGIHLHMSVANSEGDIFGGHLMEGSIIFTTAEVVIAKLSDLEFSRVFCDSTGFLELCVNPRDTKK